jgi:ribosomal protein S12 methylthiotransferase accessory factor
MSSAPLTVTIPRNRRVDVAVRGHLIHTDQPLDNGGEDSAPSPFELFLASIGACAGIFVQGFCAKRGIDPSGITITQDPVHRADGSLERVDLHVMVPPSFPEKYLTALVAVIDGCSVKKAIAAQPTFVTDVSVREGPASSMSHHAR